MDNDSNDVNLGMGDPLSEYTTINMSSFTYPTTGSYTIGATGSNYGNVTIGAAGSSLYSTGGLNGTSWSTTMSPSGLHVKDDAEFEGDIKWKGRSLGKILDKIESRLAILEDPDPAKLEKYAALKKAYEHYKTLERLIGED